MRPRKAMTYVRRTLAMGACLLAVSPQLGQAGPAGAQTAPGAQISQISRGGWGNAASKYAWSMEWFKGKLYVGTAQDFVCVERASADFFFPGQFYTTEPVPGFPVSCPADRYDLNLQAELWQFTPETNTWKRVYQSPRDIPNPRAPGKFVSRDIGFRGMVVYTPPGGTETLYVLGVTANEYIPELSATNPPRILRSTDGETFVPVPGAPDVLDSKFGLKPPIGYRASAVHDGRLFVTATTGLAGDGVIIEVGNPGGPNPTFTQVSPNSLAVYELDVFNGLLYAGTGDVDLTTGQGTGYGVYKTAAAGGRPYQFAPVVAGGAGRGATISSVVSMHPFNGRLYVGAGAFQAELIRINPDDSWELVTGNPRWVGPQYKSPISGLPDGFGNPFNAHFWRMQSHQGNLFLGTNDWSWILATTVIDPFLRFGYGFDVFTTQDGVFWAIGTLNAFGDGLYNFGSRTMVSTPRGGFVGSTNHVEGAATWTYSADPPAPAGAQAPPMPIALTRLAGWPSRTGRALAPPSPLRPRRLLADSENGAHVVSWDPAPGASRYRVLRAEFRSARELKVPSPPGRRQPPPEGGWFREWKLPEDAWIPGPFTPIGSTSELFLVDKGAKHDVRYAYQVEVENPPGGAASPSNVVVVPSTPSPAGAFDAVQTRVREPEARGRISAADGSRLRQELAQAESAAKGGDLSSTYRRLEALRLALERNEVGSLEGLTAEDLEIAVARLERRVSLARAGVLSLGAGTASATSTGRPTPGAAATPGSPR